MEVQEVRDDQKQKQYITIFGEPVIKTRCQRNAAISAIAGGIAGGLMAFLFTSKPRYSTQIGVATYFVIGVTYACYCAYDEFNARKQRKLLRQMMYETRDMNLLDDKSKKLKDA